MNAAHRGIRLLVALSAVVLPLSALAQDATYDILVTNDDGIESPGIEVLAQHLRAVGRVVVVAPCGERSGSSMSVLLRNELVLRPFQREDGTTEHCVDATPAGAAMLALSTLAPDGGFDLVVSGINRGANVGTASHMSGTVGAAMMGAFYGVPAIAVSLGARSMDFDYTARFVAEFAEQLKSRAPTPGIVFSINVPQATEAENGGVVVAPMGGIHLSFAYEEVAGDTDERRFRPRIGFESGAPAGSDTEAFLNDMVTITPLRFDWTAHDLVDELRTWDLSHKPMR